GATSAFYVLVRLPYAVKDLFQSWLERHFPDRKDKVLNQLKAMRGGKLYDSKWGTRGRGEGGFSEDYAKLFAFARKRYGLDKPGPGLTAEHFRRPPEPPGPQLELF